MSCLLADNFIQSVIKKIVLFCGLPVYDTMCFDGWLPPSHPSINFLKDNRKIVTAHTLRAYGRGA